MTFKAILWDMNGTLIDSEPFHGQAFEATIAALEFTLPVDIYTSQAAVNFSMI